MKLEHPNDMTAKQMRAMLRGIEQLFRNNPKPENMVSPERKKLWQQSRARAATQQDRKAKIAAAWQWAEEQVQRLHEEAPDWFPLRKRLTRQLAQARIRKMFRL